MGRLTKLGFSILVILVASFSQAVPAQPSPVVIYTSVDQVYAEPVLHAFETQTGIDVKPVYDVEASKTVGLEKRLLAEKEHPRADVFWNSEYLRTLRLARQNVLTPYRSEAAARIPADARDAQAYWTGFGSRYRVFVVNKQLLAPGQYPKRLADLIDPRWRGMAAVAKPLFGTTSTHFAALYATWGNDRFRKFIQGLTANEVAFLPGNAAVCDAVVAGDYAFGLTDTDDVTVALKRGAEVAMVFPDQHEQGAFAIPLAVAVVAGGPNPGNGRKLIDYLLSPEVEHALNKAGALHGPVGGAVTDGEGHPLKRWHYTSPDLLEALEASSRIIEDVLSR